MDHILWHFEHSVICAANCSLVWKFYSNVANWKRIEGEAVEWIKLNGPFSQGTQGITKVPGHDPHHWEIVQLEPERLVTIKMNIGDSDFFNTLLFEAIPGDKTRIIQQLSLHGPEDSPQKAAMKIFEENSPQGLKKLARTIESDKPDTHSNGID